MQKWMVVMVMVLMTALVGNGSQARASEGFYAGIQVGAVELEDTETDSSKGEMKTGYVLSGSAGYDFGHLRLEGEIAYRENDLGKTIISNTNADSNGDVSAFAFMVNGYFDLENRTAFTPYIGAGLGYARVEIDGKATYGSNTTVEWDDHDSGLAYQLMAGLAWDLSDTIVLDVSYRYLDCDDIEIAGTSNWGFTAEDEIDYESHNFMIGLKWFF
jgi:opacity protein-like surface antigen